MPKHPRPWPLTYQICVNGIILDQQLRPAGVGRLMSTEEHEALERAYYAGESPEEFVARVVGEPMAEMAVVAE